MTRLNSHHEKVSILLYNKRRFFYQASHWFPLIFEIFIITHQESFLHNLKHEIFNCYEAIIIGYSHCNQKVAFCMMLRTPFFNITIFALILIHKLLLSDMLLTSRFYSNSHWWDQNILQYFNENQCQQTNSKTNIVLRIRSRVFWPKIEKLKNLLVYLMFEYFSKQNGIKKSNSNMTDRVLKVLYFTDRVLKVLYFIHHTGQIRFSIHQKWENIFLVTQKW